MTLRTRLLLTLVGLVAAGLALAGAATYGALSTYLNGRVDAQLADAYPALLRDLAAASTGALPDGGLPPGGIPDGGRGGGGRDGARDLPGGTVAELRDADGTVLLRRRIGISPGADGSVARLPQKLAGLPVTSLAAGQRARPTNLRGLNGTRYRAVRLALPSGASVVVAIPVGDVRETLRRLLLTELAVATTVLGLLAAASYLLVRRGLAPLERMAGTADAIAAGDLTRRVDEADPRTEVGRLGGALNRMLGQIESSFAVREESERSMRRFLADASHELRTPLTSIRGYAEMFRRGAADRPADLAIAMRRIESEGARMGGLVEDLLTLARLDEHRPLQRDPVDLEVLVRDAALDGAAVAPDRDVTADTTGPVLVAGDESRLRQAVANLVVNAVHHTPAGTPVQLSLREAAGTAVLTVRDHGPGIPPGDAERVFERFWRSDTSRTRESGGNGLGLAIVASVVQAHGGNVRVGPAQGGGALITLELPILVPDSQAPPRLS